MGLFNFGNKKKEASEIKMPSAFYADCVADFHQEAQKHGAACKGLIFIPELIPIGENTILAFLKDPFFQMQFGNDAQTYYFFIMAMSIDAGMLFATKWHEDDGGLEDYVEEIIDIGPADDANILLSKHFPSSISADQGNPFFQKIFARWMKAHDPYWKQSDPREYTFRAMVAAYQLGVSMMLEKLGY